MDRRTRYYRQVQLLLRVIPLVAKHECFALKGGTAINLFVRNLPRLSVDLDLVFLPAMERSEALATIRESLQELATAIKTRDPDVTVVESFREKEDALRLIISRVDAQIKIELSPVLRGTIFEPQLMPVCEAVEEKFGFAEIRVVAHADLYAGKLCAVLDRQHPRDLFDVKWLLDNEGVTDTLRRALLVYMISHQRPIAELLRPRFKDISGLYHGEFTDMAEHEVSLSALEAARERLVEHINAALTDGERKFLLSFKAGTPDWELLGLNGVERLPAVRWKQRNLARMHPGRHRKAYRQLEAVLAGRQ